MNKLDKSLIRRVVTAERHRIRYEHQLRELENGRVFRSIQLLKRIKANPKNATTYIKQAPNLLSKVETLPLPEKMPSEEDVVLSMSAGNGLPSLGSNAPDFRYPNIKIATIGSTDYFAGLCHIFKVEDGPWEYFIEKGMELLLIDLQDDYDQQIAEKAIAIFSENNIPIVYFVRDKEELSRGLFMESASLIVYDNPTLTVAVEQSTKPSLLFKPSVDIKAYNPINWSRNSSVNTFKYNPEATLDHMKSSRATEIDKNSFAEPLEYEKTVLNLIASGIPLCIDKTDTLTEIIDNYPFCENKDAANKFRKKMASTDEREKHSIFWRRHIINNHSRLQRFEELIGVLDLPLRPTPKISIIHSTSRPDFLEHAMKNIDRQKYSSIETILVLHGDDFEKKFVNSVVKKMKNDVKIIYRPSSSVFGDNLNIAVEASTGELIAKFDDDDWYGPHHLDDLYAAWRYSEADIVGKWGNIVYVSNLDKTVDFVTKREEKYGNHLPGGTILTTRSLLINNRFGHIKRGIDSELYRRLEPRGLSLYSTHRYNFIRVRHDDHTYKIEDEAWIADADGQPRNGLAPDESFI